MKSPMHIGILQYDIKWKDKDGNLELIESLFDSNSKPVDIVVLPELFNTGFVTDDPGLAEEEDGKTVTWMKEKSVQWACLLMGSLIIKSNGKFYNRLICTSQGEIIHRYDKRHLFSLGGEARFFSCGDKSQRRSFVYSGWRLRTQICYDLRFPVWSRNDDDYDLLLTVANWPEQRIAAWETLLQARAIENQCYSIGVNRLGVDGMDLRYPGRSCVFDSLGRCLHSSEHERLHLVEVLADNISSTRNKLPFLKDRDKFVLD